jgi:hypothetical protein
LAPQHSLGGYIGSGLLFEWLCNRQIALPKRADLCRRKCSKPQWACPRAFAAASGRSKRADRLRSPRLPHPRALTPNVRQESTCVARLTDGAAWVLTVAIRLLARTNRAAGTPYRRATMPVGDAHTRVSAEEPSLPLCGPLLGMRYDSPAVLRCRLQSLPGGEPLRALASDMAFQVEEVRCNLRHRSNCHCRAQGPPVQCILLSFTASQGYSQLPLASTSPALSLHVAST